MGKDLFDAIKAKRPYPEQLAVHDEFIREFRAIIKYNKDSWKHEYEYYAKKGWL
jgi:hypothetical protein